LVYLSRTRKKNRRTTADIYDKFRDLVTKQSSLPAEIHLNNDNAYDVWVIYRALERRFLPSQIMNESESLLMDMVTLDSAFEAIREASNAKGKNE
jgi:hypothetical protein